MCNNLFDIAIMFVLIQPSWVIIDKKQLKQFTYWYKLYLKCKIFKRRDVIKLYKFRSIKLPLNCIAIK